MKNSFTSSLLVSILLTLCWIAPARGVGDDVDAMEQKVFSAIGDFASMRDELAKEKYCVVLHGEVTGFDRRDQPMRSSPIVQVRCVDPKRKFDLRARYHLVNQTEYGAEVVSVGTKYKGRDHTTMFRMPYDVKPKAEKLSDWLKKYRLAGQFDPFEDIMLGPVAFKNVDARGSVERVYLARDELVDSKPGLNGQLTGKWKNADFDFFVNVTFDPAYENLPIRFEFHDEKNENHFYSLRCKWKKVRKQLLPHRIEWAAGNQQRYGPTMDEGVFKAYWLVGEEVPDKFFTEELHLETILDHFEIPRSILVGRQLEMMPHDLPSDLYAPDSDEKLKRR